MDAILFGDVLITNKWLKKRGVIRRILYIIRELSKRAIYLHVIYVRERMVLWKNNKMKLT